MSAPINDGGPAFQISIPGAGGMSLRDYFIAHLSDENVAGEQGDYADIVKAELVGRPCPSGSIHGWTQVLEFEAEFRAKWRAMRADAMLKAREA